MPQGRRGARAGRDGAPCPGDRQGRAVHGRQGVRGRGEAAGTQAAGHQLRVGRDRGLGRGARARGRRSIAPPCGRWRDDGRDRGDQNEIVQAPAGAWRSCFAAPGMPAFVECSVRMARPSALPDGSEGGACGPIVACSSMLAAGSASSPCPACPPADPRPLPALPGGACRTRATLPPGAVLSSGHVPKGALAVHGRPAGPAGGRASEACARRDAGRQRGALPCTAGFVHGACTGPYLPSSALWAARPAAMPAASSDSSCSPASIHAAAAAR